MIKIIVSIFITCIISPIYAQNEPLDVIQRTQRHYCYYCEKGYNQITLKISTNSDRLNEELSCSSINLNKYKLYKLWLNKYTNLKEEDHSLSGILWERNDKCTNSFNNSTRHDMRTSVAVEENYHYEVSHEELLEVEKTFDYYCDQLILAENKKKEKLIEQEKLEQKKLEELKELKQREKSELERIQNSWIDQEYNARKAFADKKYSESNQLIKNLIEEIKAFKYSNSTLFDIDESINPLGSSCKVTIGYHGMSANELVPNSNFPDIFYFNMLVENGGRTEYIILHDRILLELLKASLLSMNANQFIGSSGPKLKSYITLNMREYITSRKSYRYYEPESRDAELYGMNAFDLSVYNYLIYSSTSDYTREINLILGFMYASQCNIEKATSYWDGAFRQDNDKSLLSFGYFYSIHFSEVFQDNKCALKICKKYWKTKSSLSL